MQVVVSLRVLSADGYCSLQFASIHDPDIGLIIYYLLKDVRVIFCGVVGRGVTLHGFFNTLLNRR
jgi:hypothetical protein